MNIPLFPTTLSIPSYDMGKYVCRGKDLSAATRKTVTAILIKE